MKVDISAIPLYEGRCCQAKNDAPGGFLFSQPDASYSVIDCDQADHELHNVLTPFGDGAYGLADCLFGGSTRFRVDPEGSSPANAGLSRRNLVFQRTQTMMQLCASAAKLRGGGPILIFGVKAMGMCRVTTTSDRHRQIHPTNFSG